MERYLTKRTVAVIAICSLIAIAVQADYEQGLKYYQSNETDKAVASFKDALASVFGEPASGKLQQAVSLAQSGKADEAEKILLSLFDDDATAARARYELGRIYETQSKLDEAATLFRNALAIISNKGAKYIGAKKCKMCHLKQYKSWKKIKMAKAFETLKPGVSAEAKAKFNFDPQKDYTKDSKCLTCHTTGFGLPGGYRIPKAGDARAARAAKANAGITCEACHGPGSKFVKVHKDIMTKKRNYTQDELYQAGQYKIDAGVCTTCHNRRNPAAGPDYHFDYEKSKAEDSHENIPLKYRAEQ